MSHVVVVGLGYVGLPLVDEACRSGLQVTGFDINSDVVATLNSGKSHVDDLGDDRVAELIQLGFRATTDAAVVAAAETVVICVPTPLSADGGPDLAAVEFACRSIAPHMAVGTLVVLESTTYPGTTAEFVTPLLEQVSGLRVDVDFFVAYSPERIDPGNHQYGLRNTPKIVGADGDTARALAAEFYSRVVDEVVLARGSREAESAKLLENTYRHVNIALVNEMARFFHELSIDFWNVIELASTKPFGFHAFRPGPGVGGHCIPIDPNYLSHRVRSQLGYGFRFVELAQEVNASMPAYVVFRAAELLNDSAKALRGSRVILLGVTYKADIADVRESPAVAVAEKLVASGASVRFCDPHVDVWNVDGVSPVEGDLLEAVREADLTILLQAHSQFDLDAIADAAGVLFDTRGAVTSTRSVRL
ncbi:nucleotide sugar dehydrogenase [Nocardioides panaciterrulae]|uniref:Nucleotide sugar dehydrogenase n=1 Tax=Nocardioides panaciterrulae TaxID=661492 RepID=A0A7Y9J9M9_9ACTN|nr:nucleotide sugar dehydrogenase [Nocardioides panaciterrulae]